MTGNAYRHRTSDGEGCELCGQQLFFFFPQVARQGKARVDGRVVELDLPYSMGEVQRHICVRASHGGGNQMTSAIVCVCVCRRGKD